MARAERRRKRREQEVASPGASDIEPSSYRRRAASAIVENPPEPELEFDEDLTQPDSEQIKKEQEKKKGDVDEDFDPKVYEQRINELQLEIEIKTTKNTSFLMRNWRKDNSFDPSWGRCCCYYGNRRGAKIILLFDFLFIVNILRWIFAARAICDKGNKKKYA